MESLIRIIFSLALVGSALGGVPEMSVPYATRKPSLKAEWGERAWEEAGVIAKLTPSLGSDPALTPQATEVRLLWDEANLYIRFTCEAKEIVATLSGRDTEYHKEEAVEVFLDPARDGKAYIELQVSPNNGVRDVLYLCTGEPRYDENGRFLPEILKRDSWSFDTWNLDGLRTATGRFSEDGKQGWIAEIAIPSTVLRRLGAAQFNEMALKANFIRLEHPKAGPDSAKRLFLSSDWSPVLQGNPHRSPGAYGTINLTREAEERP